MINELLNPKIKNLDANYEKLTPEMFESALEETFQKRSAETEKKRKFKNVTYKDLNDSEIEKQFDYIFNLLQTLNSLQENPKLREIEDKYSEKNIEFRMKCLFDKALFKQLERFINSDEFQGLNDIRKKMLNKCLSDWRKSGIDLSKAKQKRFAKIRQQQSKLQNKFSNNITDADKNMFLIVSEKTLRGLPERALLNAKKLSQEKGVPAGKLYIDEVSGLFADVMENVRNEGVRKRIYNLRKNKCLKGKFSNVKLIDQIYKDSFEIANILGYKTAAHNVLEDNMAATPERVAEFISFLGNEAAPFAKKEVKELYDFGQKVLKRPMQVWDNIYVANKMEQKVANLNQEELKKYFPVDHVIKGLFEFCKDKFDVSFKKIDKKMWHKDVIVYEVYEGESLTGTLVMDLYRREGKSDGAWLSPISTYCNNDLEKNLPCALLVCNVSKDQGVPTFKFDDVITLFHEMGHGLHLLLSKVSEDYYSGFNNVQFDAIEFPSQLLESFVYNTDVLKSISKNIENNKTLSNSLIAKIQKNKKFMGANSIMRTLIYSDIDQKLYTQNVKHPFEVEKEVRENWLINENSDLENYMTKTFRHIFGGYCSNYYVYQWAEVMAADAYNYLTENVSEKEVQERFTRYKQTVLYTGGEQSMNNNYHDFAKREPQVKALVNQYI